VIAPEFVERSWARQHLTFFGAGGLVVAVLLVIFGLPRLSASADPIPWMDWVWPAAFEEALKWVAGTVAIWRLGRPRSGEVRETMVAFGLVGLGFATVETLGYALSVGEVVPVWAPLFIGFTVGLRSVFAASVHVLVSGIVGYGHGQFSGLRRVAAVVVALTVATGLHATYNWAWNSGPGAAAGVAVTAGVVWGLLFRTTLRTTSLQGRFDKQRSARDQQPQAFARADAATSTGPEPVVDARPAGFSPCAACDELIAMRTSVCPYCGSAQQPKTDPAERRQCPRCRAAVSPEQDQCMACLARLW